MGADHVQARLPEALLREREPDLVDRALEPGAALGRRLPAAAIGLVAQDLEAYVGLGQLPGDDRVLDFSDASDLFTIAGSTVRMTVDGLFTRTAVLDESGGEILVTLTPEDTEDCPDRRTVYAWELEATEQDGDVKTLRRGRFVVLPDLAHVT